MPKYDGPSYQKGQKRSHKTKFPFYRDSEHVAKKESLFTRTKNSQLEQPIKLTRELPTKGSEMLFSELISQNNLERKQRTEKSKVIATQKAQLKKEKEAMGNRIRNHEKAKEALKNDDMPFQTGRSSTPFKVQKIPSPYYGFQENDKKEKKKIDYKKIAQELKKEANEFILLVDHLSAKMESLFKKEHAVPFSATTPEEPVVLENPEEEKQSSSFNQRKRTLRRSLAGMIEEDQDTRLNHGKNVSGYFNEKGTDNEIVMPEEPEILVPNEILRVSEEPKETDLAVNLEPLPTLEKESAIEEANESIEESQENKAAVPDNEIQSTVIDADASQPKEDETSAAMDADLSESTEASLAESTTEELTAEEIEMLEFKAAMSRLHYLDKQTFKEQEPDILEEKELPQKKLEEQLNRELQKELPDRHGDEKADQTISSAAPIILTENGAELPHKESLNEEPATLSVSETAMTAEEPTNDLPHQEKTFVSARNELSNENNTQTTEKNEKQPLVATGKLEEELEEEVELSAYQFPSLELLNPPVEFKSNAVDDWVLGQAELLNETLDAFNINAQVVGWTVGPAVTQFELQLGRGVKVNKITNLSDDLKLALAAKDIRIEAPIPGKSTVGVEIPNKNSRPVMLSEVMASEEFKNNPSPLTVAIGVNLAGDAVVSTIDKMPHGLIAGATGSGKSVFINSILVSLLYKAKPSEVKLILIDPKAVELAPYNAIPHLLSPVISEPKAASEALKWAVNEMEERYQKLAAAGVRNIQRFNEKAEEHGDYGLRLPYIVIVIDELADLMMVASSDVQDSIVRITQKARAAGIHLLVATQRPSVDVITGTIKNNIPTRVAFMVSSQVDSRTIMDSGGAEKLLGRGDMLFLENGASQPIRIQGTYVEKEIDSIVKHVKDQRKTNYLFEPETLLARVEAVENKDELFGEILPFIIDEGQVSASSLQRKFKIGFNRASNLIESLESENLISANKGSKPRDVFITKADYEEKYL